MAPELPTVGGDQSLQELRRELAEAREQQAATSEILRVISSSPTVLQRAFAEIAASAARLCDAYDAVIFQVDGNCLRLVAHHGAIPAGPIGQFTLPLTREVTLSRAVLERQIIHVADLQAEIDEYPEGSSRAQDLGVRTVLNVPLIRAGKAIGSIGIRRTEVRPFTDRQIDLLKTFADQAVIAIENARLFEEVQTRTREAIDRSRELARALEQQAATSDVLSIISRSPTNLQPVFDTIARSAAQLCKAKLCNVFRFDGQLLHVVASYFPDSPEGEDFNANQPSIRPGRGSVAARAIATRTVVVIADIEQDPDYEMAHIARFGNVRSILAVPILKAGNPIGAIAVGRSEAGDYSEQQRELLRTFADQAVIAIENTRLFEAEQARSRELQESLEYQTATGEVLGVISRSPTELQPVLDSIAATAARLCESVDAQVYRVQDGKLAMVAQHGNLQRPPATFAGLPLTRGTVTGRAVLDQQTIHVDDVAALLESEYPDAKSPQAAVGHRTTLATPLLRRGEALGAILLRRLEVRPFTAKQRVLLHMFADQAVIAIENARLFEQVQARTRELQGSLEYQTATGEILNVISRSPNKLQPVLDAIVQTAHKLCQSDRAQFFILENGKHHLAAYRGTTNPQFQEYLANNPIAPEPGFGSATGKAARELRTIHVPDSVADPEFATGEIHRAGRGRSVLAVPLVREGEALGVITVARDVVKPFTASEIELNETFADQALIAIENTRLFAELQARTAELSQSLEYQTAISEVLGVISRSPSHVYPVLETIVKTARRLCEADRAIVLRLENGRFIPVARDGITRTAFDELMDQKPPVADHTTVAGRALLEKRAIHINDFQAEPGLTNLKGAVGDPRRTMLGVPLFRDTAAIGAIVLTRTEVRPFDKQQIDLVTTFADQAVIAIENARLFEEVQSRTSELQESLEHQTATADVLKVISRSAFDLQAVLDTLVQSAATLCEADMANIWRPKDGAYRLATSFGVASQHGDWLAMNDYLGKVAYGPGRGSVVGRTLLARTTVQIEDIRADPEYDQAAVRAIEGLSTFLGVPLLRAGNSIGVMVLVR